MYWEKWLDVVPLVDTFRESEFYEEDMFISGSDAATNIGKNDALIIVDCAGQATQSIRNWFEEHNVCWYLTITDRQRM